MKKAFTILFLISLTANSSVTIAQRVKTKQQFRNAARQVSYMLATIDSMKVVSSPSGVVAPRTSENGKLKMVKGTDWTSGFFAGNLWYMYEQTRDESLLNAAKKYTSLLEPLQFFAGHHDLGFMMYCSYGNGFRLTGDTAYKRVIIQAARTLSTRFNKTTGVIKSWDFASDHKWKYPVIIDNMMNLELLFEATNLTGDSSFYRIAVTHANTTINNHYRPDNSSVHVVDYDPETGAVRQKHTAQGFSDASAWARGQAWGLYGFTMSYRKTRDAAYLQQAEKVAAYILSRLPKDMVPFWDHDAPGIPGEPRDASAAAITASALYELHTFNKKAGYKKAADKMLDALCSNYLAKPRTYNGFILLHSTGHKPAQSEVDVPIIYADYYFLEALKRSKSMK